MLSQPKAPDCAFMPTSDEHSRDANHSSQLIKWGIWTNALFPYKLKTPKIKIKNSYEPWLDDNNDNGDDDGGKGGGGGGNDDFIYHTHITG